LRQAKTARVILVRWCLYHHYVRGIISLDGLEDTLRAIVREELTGARQEPTGYLSVDSAAKFLDTSPAAVRSLVKRGQLPVCKTPQGRLLFDLRALDSYVRNEPLP
jgi:hypothetical protein